MGNYNLTVSTVPDDNHNSVTKIVAVTVNKINSTVDVGAVELDYGSSVNVSVTAEGAVGITAMIDGDSVGVVGFVVPVSGLDAGNYSLTVTTVPDDNHYAVTKTVKITVNKIDKNYEGPYHFSHETHGNVAESFCFRNMHFGGSALEHL